ncbi:hypothetical protein SNE40_001269 [Patella caerulea]
MSGTDLFTFNTFGKRPMKEQVTPHKLSVLILVHKYQTLRLPTILHEGLMDDSLEEIVFTENEKRDFMTTILDLLQSSDIELKELRAKLHGVVKPVVLDFFFDKLKEIHDDGLQPIMKFFHDINDLVSHDSESKPFISKYSVLGFFFRRMILAFNKLSFSQVTELWAKIKHYYELCFPNNEPEADLAKSLTDSVMSLSGTGGPLTKSCLAQSFEGLQISENTVGGFYSQKQAEYFIAQQASLLHHNESKALSPRKLQDKITVILKANKDLAEAHFLSYLNSLRVKEYCTAIHNLYHYYDRNAKISSTSTTAKDKEDLSIRYAALNVAALHFRFGHHGEAMASLIESIHKAQEVNDHVCLQHALAWLQRFGQQGVAAMAHLIEKSITRSEDLSLPYLTSLGVQVLARHNAFVFEKPASVFEYLEYSDILNCQNFLTGMIQVSYTQKSALWHLFGKSELSSMSSLLVLNLDTIESGVSDNTELSCIALCNLAEKHAERGQYQIATDLLNHAKLRFPVDCVDSHHWMKSEQQINFDRMLNNRKWNLVEQAVINLRVVAEDESNLRNAIYLCEKGEATQAFNQLQKLLEDMKDTTDGKELDFQCRVLLAMSRLYINTGNHTTAIIHVLDCISKARSHHMNYFIAIASVQLAFIQYHMKLPEQALGLLERNMLPVLTNGSIYDQARTLYCYARVQVACARHSQQDKKSALLSAVSVMNLVIELFKKVEAHHRVKDGVYYQARLYNDLGYTAERNKCAHDFKQLDQQHPTLNQMSINAF